MADNICSQEPKGLLAHLGWPCGVSPVCIQVWICGDILMKEISKKQFKNLYRMQMKCSTVYCCLCGKPILKEKDFSIEHCQPLSRKGADDASNWSVAHKSCNSKKGSLTMSEWKLWQELERKRHGITR